MMDSKAKELFEALRASGFNQSAAARLLGCSRETVRQRLLDVRGFEGLIAWAAANGLASEAEANALSAAIALAPANCQGANLPSGANDARGEDVANPHEIRHLTGWRGRPIFSDSMSSTVAIPQSSTIRVGGDDREFLKRVALEVSLLLGLPREDMSGVVSRMIGYVRGGSNDARHVARLLVQPNGGEE